MTHAPDNVVLHKHLAPQTIMIGALGKSLINNNVITKDQLIKELEYYRGKEGETELDTLIDTIRSW